MLSHVNVTKSQVLHPAQFVEWSSMRITDSHLSSLWVRVQMWNTFPGSYIVERLLPRSAWLCRHNSRSLKALPLPLVTWRYKTSHTAYKLRQGLAKCEQVLAFRHKLCPTCQALWSHEQAWSTGLCIHHDYHNGYHKLVRCHRSTRWVPQSLLY